jgi:hypothetical protein
MGDWQYGSSISSLTVAGRDKALHPDVFFLSGMHAIDRDCGPIGHQPNADLEAGR